jgi:hypothetical protein
MFRAPTLPGYSSAALFLGQLAACPRIHISAPLSHRPTPSFDFFMITLRICVHRKIAKYVPHYATKSFEICIKTWKYPLKSPLRGKVRPTTSHEGTERKQRYTRSSTISLTLALEGVDGQRHALATSLPGITRYPLCRRLRWPQMRSGQARKISTPRGFDPRTVQSVASRYAYKTIHTNYTAYSVLGGKSAYCQQVTFLCFQKTQDHMKLQRGILFSKYCICKRKVFSTLVNGRFAIKHFRDF